MIGNVRDANLSMADAVYCMIIETSMFRGSCFVFYTNIVYSRREIRGSQIIAFVNTFSGFTRYSNESTRLIITTIIGIVFGYLIGTSFPSVSITKLQFPLSIISYIKDRDSGITTQNVNNSTSLSANGLKMYTEIIESLNEYEVVINRWPQYLLALESVVTEVERAIMKSMERIYSETLMPLRDWLPKMLEKQVNKFTGRQSMSLYAVPYQLGTFLNIVKRIIDVLHYRVEENLKSWEAYIKISDGTFVFGEQMNGVTIMLRKKYKKYREAIVKRLVENTQVTKNTRLKRILEETKEAESEADMRERLQALCLQLTDNIHNLHTVFSSRLFVAICRDFWDRMGKI